MQCRHFMFFGMVLESRGCLQSLARARITRPRIPLLIRAVPGAAACPLAQERPWVFGSTGAHFRLPVVCPAQ